MFLCRLASQTPRVVRCSEQAHSLTHVSSSRAAVLFVKPTFLFSVETQGNRDFGASVQSVTGENRLKEILQSVTGENRLKGGGTKIRYCGFLGTNF